LLEFLPPGLIKFAFPAVEYGISQSKLGKTNHQRISAFSLLYQRAENWE